MHSSGQPVNNYAERGVDSGGIVFSVGSPVEDEPFFLFLGARPCSPAPFGGAWLVQHH